MVNCYGSWISSISESTLSFQYLFKTISYFANIVIDLSISISC